MLRNIYRATPKVYARLCLSDKSTEAVNTVKSCQKHLAEHGKVTKLHKNLGLASAKQKAFSSNCSSLTWSRLSGQKAHPNSSVPVALGAGLVAFSLFGKKKEEEEEEEDTLITTIKWAKLHALKGELEKSDAKYHEALKMVQARGKSGEWEKEKVIQAQTYLYDSMANLALQAMQLKKAEALFKETMVGLLEMGREKTDNAMVEISLKLAVIYGMMEKHTEAEAGYAFCINSLENKVSQKDFDTSDEDTLGLLGMSLNSYARYMIVQKKYDKALNNIEKSLDIAKKVLGAEHHQVCVLYSDAATISTLKGDFVAAKKYIDKAVELGRKVQSPDLAMFICNQGVVNLNSGKLDEAKKLCSDALKMAKQVDDKMTIKEAQVCLEKVKKKEAGKSK